MLSFAVVFLVRTITRKHDVVFCMRVVDLVCIALLFVTAVLPPSLGSDV